MAAAAKQPDANLLRAIPATTRPREAPPWGPLSTPHRSRVISPWESTAPTQIVPKSGGGPSSYPTQNQQPRYRRWNCRRPCSRRAFRLWKPSESEIEGWFHFSGHQHHYITGASPAASSKVVEVLCSWRCISLFTFSFLESVF
uniref:Uncharacterized protein n=1 Tax=Arundo donax TaxID=35708 RepID=A0A0A8YQH3_ARUDO